MACEGNYFSQPLRIDTPVVYKFDELRPVDGLCCFWNSLENKGDVRVRETETRAMEESSRRSRGVF